MPWMSILAKIENTQKNAKKQQPTEKQKNTKYQNVSYRGPRFCICQGRLDSPCQLRH